MKRRSVVVATVTVVVAGTLLLTHALWTGHPSNREVRIAEEPTDAPSASTAETSTSREPSPTPSGTSESAPPGSASPDPGEPEDEPRMDVKTPSVSRDGSIVAFATSTALVDDDTNQADDVFVRSRKTHETIRVSVSTSGEQGDRESFAPAISADGTRVAFISTATNLVPGDTNGEADAFVHDLVDHTTIRISVSSDGGQANGHSYSFKRAWNALGMNIVSISADGRYVAFHSTASNLVPGDGNGETDVFVHDIETGQTVCASVGPDGKTPSDESMDPALSGDGRLIAFMSYATDIVEGGSIGPRHGGYAQIFVRDLEKNVTTQASIRSDGSALPGPSQTPAFDAAGDLLAFVTYGEDTGRFSEVAVRNLATGSTRFAYRCMDCWEVSISADGRVVGYGTAPQPFCHVDGTDIAPCSSLAVSAGGRYIAYHRDVDPERDDFSFGAMIYDRTTGKSTPAWEI